jgi:hypothetical protein
MVTGPEAVSLGGSGAPSALAPPSNDAPSCAVDASLDALLCEASPSAASTPLPEFPWLPPTQCAVAAKASRVAVLVPVTLESTAREQGRVCSC